MTLPARVDRAIARRRPVVPMANFDIHLPGRMGRRYGVDVIRDARDHLSERSISPDREVNPPRNPLVDATPAPLPVGRPLPDVARVTHAATRVVTERRLTPLAGVSPVNPRTRRTRMAESPVVSAIASSSGRSRLAPITASTINPPQVTATNPTRLSPMANPPMPGAVVDRGGPTRLNPIIPSEPRATPTVDVPNGASFRPAPLLTESVSVVDVPRRDSFRPTPLPTESVPVFSGGVFLGSESDASSETGSLDGESVFEVDDEAMRFERGAEEDGMVDGALGTSETGVGGVESGLPELVPDQPTAALSDSNPVDDAAAEAARLAEEQARVAEEQVRVAAEQVRLAEEAREKEAADNVRRAAQPPVTTPPMSDEEAAALVDEFMREESGVVDDSASPVVDESVVGAEAVGSVLARPTGDALDSLLEEYDGVGGGSENDLDDIFDGDELPLSLDSASSLSRNPIVLPVIGAPTVSVGDASSETGSLDGESVFEVDDEAMRFERGAEEDGMVDGALGTSETGVGGVESGLPELVPDQPTAALSDSNPVDDAAAEAARLAEEQARVAEEQVRVAAEQVRLAEEAREKEAADNVRRAAQPPVTTPPMSDEEAAALVDEFMREESGVVDDSASPVVDESVVGAEAVGSVLARPTGDALDSLLEEYDGVGGGSENDLDDIFDGDELPLSLDSASSLSRNPIVLPVIGAPTVSVGDGVVASAVDSVVTTVVTDDPAVLTTIEDDITITDLDDEDRLASPQTALEQELKEAFEAREKRMGERRTPSDRPVFNPDLAREIRAAANRVGAVSGGDATLDVPSAVSDVVEDDEVDGVAPDSMPLSLSTAPVLDGDAAVLSASDLDLSAAFGNAINAAQAEIERINNANARMAEYDDMPVLDLDEVGEKMAVTTQTNVVDESEELEDVGGVPLFDEDLEDEPESKLAAEAAKDAEGDAVEIVEDEAEAATPLVAEQVADADQDKKEAEEVATKEDVEQKAEEEEEKKKRDAAANTQAGDAVTPAAEKIKLPPDVKAEEKEDGSMMMKLLYLVIFTACIAAIVFFPVIAPLALPGAMATAATGIVKNVKPRNDAKVPDPQSSPPSPPPTPEVTEAATDAVKGLVTALSSNDANLENTDATDAIPPKPAVVIDPNAPQQVDTGRAA